jgi:hypothetical protein
MDNFGFETGYLILLYYHIASNNYQIARLNPAGGGPIYTHLPGTPVCGLGIGFKPLAVGDIIDGYLFIRGNSGSFHQFGVNGDAAGIIKIGVGNRGAMYLGFEHNTGHNSFL